MCLIAFRGKSEIQCYGIILPCAFYQYILIKQTEGDSGIFFFRFISDSIIRTYETSGRYWNMFYGIKFMFVLTLLYALICDWVVAVLAD